MKTIKVYSRVILERTRYVKFRYQEKEEISIIYEGKEVSNHYGSYDNPKLRIPFKKVLDTRSRKEVEAFIKSLGRTDSDKWLKDELLKILERK